MDDTAFYNSMRQRMVEEHLIRRDITDKRVLEVMSQMPRHLFVSENYRHQAYADGPLPIGDGQTISQPYIVALMTQVLHLSGNETVLEIGTGSGYQAAVLACLAAKVYTMERYPDLAEKAQTTLKSLGYDHVEVIVGDGSRGMPDHAPYDAIIVTAAAPDTPRPLLEQLADNGRLIIPTGKRWEQYLYLWERQGNSYKERSFIPVAFVPLRGEYGWDGTEWNE